MDRCKVITKDMLDKLLEAEPREQGKRILSSIKGFELPFNVLEDTEVANDAELHVKEGDLWCCLDGIVNFFVGGKLVKPWTTKCDLHGNPIELKAKVIEGGGHIVLRQGDWLWIPPGEPHQHECKGSSARLIIIKIPSKD